MTTSFLTTDLERDEGLELNAYPDPISHGPPWTIGYGHTGPDVSRGTVWTQAQAAQALASDIARTEGLLDNHLSWWRDLDDLRQDCLVNMGFNMGVGGLMKFDNFLGFLKSGDFAGAATDLAGTTWYRQVGDRAQRIERQIATGEHQS